MKHADVYYIWNGIKQRCNNENSSAFMNYGGRGIYVCKRWSKFKLFVRDMGPRPPGYSIDRIDYNGPYSPENCRWASVRTQGLSKRGLHLISAFGRTKSLARWEIDPRCNVTGTAIKQRIAKGWTAEEAIAMPPANREIMNNLRHTKRDQWLASLAG